MEHSNHADAEAVVSAFLLQCGERASAFADGLKAYFVESTIWENVGVRTTVGIDEALDLVCALQKSSWFDRVEFEVLTLACTDDLVLTERLDRVFDAAGLETMALRNMAIFEVRGGKIVAWRNYPSQPVGDSVFRPERRDEAAVSVPSASPIAKAGKP